MPPIVSPVRCAGSVFRRQGAAGAAAHSRRPERYTSMPFFISSGYNPYPSPPLPAGVHASFDSGVQTTVQVGRFHATMGYSWAPEDRRNARFVRNLYSGLFGDRGYRQPRYAMPMQAIAAGPWASAPPAWYAPPAWQAPPRRYAQDMLPANYRSLLTSQGKWAAKYRLPTEKALLSEATDRSLVTDQAERFAREGQEENQLDATIERSKQDPWGDIRRRQSLDRRIAGGPPPSHPDPQQPGSASSSLYRSGDRLT
jgi:hypothetical protein